MSRHYYQTNLLTEDQKKEYEAKAACQEAIILAYLKAKPRDAITADDLLTFGVLSMGVPITSVRRALTNLAKARLIMKVGQRTGPMGRPVNEYRVVL